MKGSHDILPDIDFQKINIIKVNDPDNFIKFLDFYNNFMNHKMNKTKPIKGDFIL